MRVLKKRELYVLKAAINGFSQEARRINKKEIQPNSHGKRENGRKRKRLLGLSARFHILAYAFMLGKRYDELEKNKPLAHNRWQTSVAANEIFAICKVYGNYYVRHNKFLSSDSVVHWLTTGENNVFCCETSDQTKKINHDIKVA